MSEITSAPQEVLFDLNALNTSLDQSIPSKKLDKNLLIATWNIRAFGDLTKKWQSGAGDSPKRDWHSVAAIAEILKRFDVIAVQEVKSNLRALRHTLKMLGPNYSFLLTDVNKGKVGNGERMAFIFDTRRVQLSGLACELVVPDEWKDSITDVALKEQFVRSPYAVSFRSNDQTFILVTLHILYGDKSADRINEIRGIAKWMADWAKDTNAYHQNLIALGDFNIDERGDLLNETFINEGLHIPAELQDPKVTRSIFNETKYYDQIAWFNGKNTLWLLYENCINETMKTPQRICIYPKDIQRITGRSERYGRNIINEIKLKLKKEPHQLVTIHEYADYSGLDLELILSRIVD